MKKIIALAALSASLLAPAVAMAGPLTTATQTQTFDFQTLFESTTLMFNGFDPALGTLNSVHFEWELDKTLMSTVLNLGSTAQLIGDPTPITSTSTTTFSGQALAIQLLDSDDLSTPGFAGSIDPFSIVGLVEIGSVAASTSGGICLSNDNTCGSSIHIIDDFIGGILTFDMSITNTSSLVGSLNGVFVTNTGTAIGSASIFYDYSPVSSGPNVPEVSTISLMSLGLSLFGIQGIIRRRKQAK